MRSSVLFAIFYSYRLLNAFAVTTLLFPDEWWQFGEPAHAVVYNFGYLTWDWRAGIRSYICILPLTFLLKLSKLFGFQEDWMVRNGSKLVMAGWMALTDLYTVKLAGRFFGSSIKPYAMLFTVLSGFHANRSIRSLSNNIEMALSTVALYYLPTRLSRGKWLLTLGLVGVACLVRITAVLFWITPLMMALRWISWRERLLMTPLVIISVILIGILIDSLFTGKLTVSWWNFYVWNIVKGVSEHYGKESMFYHLKTTLPLMINTQAGYFVLGLLRAFKSRKRLLAGFMAVFLLVSSVLMKHKETRFLAPVYPVIVLYCAYGAQQLRVMTLKRGRMVRLLTVFALIGVMVSQVIMAWFYGRVHFNGAYEIIDKLRVKIDKDSSNAPSVYFLIENHVTPFQGYLHRSGVQSDFLKCHPRAVDHLMPENESRDRDDYANNPGEFVKNKVIGYKYVVLYGKDTSLLNGAYSECGRSRNSLLAIGSNRHRGDLLIYCLKE